MATPPRGQFADVAGYKDANNNYQLVTTTRVTVYVAVPYAGSPQTTLASIFSAETGAGSPGNPFNATTGEINFWAPPGSYDIKIEDTGSPAKFATKFLRWDVVPGDKGLQSGMIGDDQVLGSAVAAASIGTSEIINDSIIADDINSALAAQVGATNATGVRRGKCIIPGAETMSNSVFGLMPTPDRVQNVVMPTDGLLFVAYQAVWNQAVNGAQAAIFIGANQLKRASSTVAAPLLINAQIASGYGSDLPLTSSPFGLNSNTVGGSPAYTGDVTTGQIVGWENSCGPCAIFVAAGTYDVSIQFRNTGGGATTAKNRKLWVWTMGF